MTLPDPQKVGQLIAEVAEARIAPRFRNLAAGDIDTKTSPQDFVTVADREAEEDLGRVLPPLVPGSMLIGEEGVSTDGSLLDRLDRAGTFWIVDPLDGTRNFVNGSDRFASMVCLVRAGEIAQSWIYHPPTGQLAIAEAGAGARLDGARLFNDLPVPFVEAKADYHHRYMPTPWQKRFRGLDNQIASVRKGGCSAFDYLDLARGEIDFVLTGRLMPWDHAPGALLVREAGGAVRLLEHAAEYEPFPYPDQPMLSVRHAADWARYAGELLAD